MGAIPVTRGAGARPHSLRQPPSSGPGSPAVRSRPGGTRTPNRRFWRPVLYHLSYGPSGSRSERLHVAWPGAESNRRHHDFQSCALPTELPGRDHSRRNKNRPDRDSVRAGDLEILREANGAFPPEKTDGSSRPPAPDHELATRPKRGRYRRRQRGTDSASRSLFPTRADASGPSTCQTPPNGGAR
jgi:hypothetical protein